MTLRALVVDDDKLSREVMQQHIANTPLVELIESVESAEDALNILTRDKVDLLFLDIEMPKVNGMELLDHIEKRPMVIFTTGMAKYACKAFDYNVLDFLLKPIEPLRFFKAINKALRQQEKEESKNTPVTKYIFIKSDSSIVKVNYSDIKWVEALGDYINIYTTGKKYVVYSTLKEIGSKMPEENFIRVHRSHIVNLDFVTGMEGNLILLDKKMIPVSRRNQKTLMKHLKLL